MTSGDIAFGKYRLHQRIGAGGMGEVWLATLPGAGGIDKPCVVKRLLARLVLDDEHQRMFRDEARIAIALQHGNVVPVLDFGEVDGTYYIAMDWVRGKNLAEILRRSKQAAAPVPVAVALFVATEVCRGLAYVHDKDLIHRDVSPANVLCSYEGDVKLSDFGIARTRERLAQTALHHLKGKVPYMSPEQARGEPVDARTDQWATGAVLYEMLTGLRPHHIPDRQLMLAARRQGAPITPLAATRADVPDGLDEVVLRALAPRAADRYAHVRDLQMELAQITARVAPRTTSADLTAFITDLFPPGAPPDVTGEVTSPRVAAVFGSADLELADDSSDEVADPPTAEVRSAGADPEWDAAPAPARHVTESLSAPAAVPRQSRRAPWVAAAAIVAFAITAGLTWWSGRGPRAQPHGPVTARPAPAVVAPPVVALPREPEPPEPLRPPEPAVPPNLDEAPAPEAEPGPEAARAATGRLEVSSVPWAEVWIDGRRRAESTPVTLRLPVGAHQVRLHNPELRLRRDERVEIRAGQTTRLARRLR